MESDNAFGQVRAANYKKCIEISVNAGMDMVMLTDRYREFIRSLTELVEEGRSRTRKGRAIARIFDCQRPMRRWSRG